MEFALLASGSQGNCFVLRDDETVIMIDCGSTKKHLLASFEKIPRATPFCIATIIAPTAPPMAALNPNAPLKIASNAANRYVMLHRSAITAKTT